jgi:hypothetical protein
MLHSVGEYESELIERYREARARLTGVPVSAKPKRQRRYTRRLPPASGELPPIPAEWPAPLPAVPYDHFEMRSPRHPLMWKSILHEVAEKHGIPVGALVGPGRQKRFANARAEASFRLVVELNLSLPQAGHRLGDRDHTTVLYFVRKHANSSEEAGRIHARWVAAREADRKARRVEAVRLHREGRTIDHIARRVTLSKATILRAVVEAQEAAVGKFSPLSTLVTEPRGDLPVDGTVLRGGSREAGQGGLESVGSISTGSESGAQE